MIEKKSSWQKTILSSTSTLQDAIISLNETALKIIIIVNQENTFLGTISDGDIRRGLLRDLSLSSPLTSIINKNSLVVPPNYPSENIQEMMRANKIHQIPIINENGSVMGLHLWDNFFEVPELENEMIIMAGGKGSRLMPHTQNCPKPMVLVAGKPMLQHIIERAKAEGFKNFTISLYYLGHMIEDYFGDGHKFGVNIKYIKEKKPLGTAGALSLILPKLSQSFLVTNGDLLTDIKYRDLLDFHFHFNSDATMAVKSHEWQNPFGVVETNGIEIIGYKEKPVIKGNINAGVYVLSPQCLDELDFGEPCDMPTLFTKLQKKLKKTIAYPMHEPWLDVGRSEDLMTARAQESKKD
jgi:dTDP-glucose pyrophosphorylase